MIKMNSISGRKLAAVQCLRLRNIFTFVFLLTAAYPSSAQPERGMLRKGNSQFKDGKFADAEISYRKALEKNRNSAIGNYNLGNALYRQQKFDEAAQQFSNGSSLLKEKELAAKNLHNMGTSLLGAKKYEQSIEALKNALKQNPDDDDTRYNLAYAQQMLKQQQQQQQQQNDKNQQQDKEDKKDQQQQQSQQKEQEQNQQQKESQAKQQQQKISKEEAERILQALRNNEKEIQKRQQKEGVKVTIEKQW